MSIRMNKLAEESGLARASELLARPWTLLIIDQLSKGPLRFTEIATSLKGISTNLLTERLRMMVAHDIARRAPGIPVSSYELTERGRSVLPALEMLRQWGEELPA
ncbi:winged helix-turn-helix transcriptional regulator [Nesterenkonia ebinurensis]|uniref:winged helix-turn-helix transcriptional regulator n=1 Tax=Nesterenkonia ebinurensis TaxID=2608252 RepID=UPI00123C8039|nr:helix-turn-helix domain-containing protein [Nesterenkonia ebinurensis]